MRYDFSRVYTRSGSGSLKYDASERLFGRGDLIPMWVADMDFAAPPCVQQAIRQRAEHPIYGYALRPDEMIAALAEWMREQHGWRLPEDGVSFLPGVVPALYMAVLAFTEPGDQVIVQPPVYPPFFHAVRENGREVLENPLRQEEGVWRMDLARLQASLTERSRLLFLCNPHNPVGRCWSADELRELLALCRRAGVLVVSDEIHCDLVYPPQRHTPAALLDDGLVSLFAPSKTFNIAGLATAAAVIGEPRQRRRFRQVLRSLHLNEGHIFGDLAFATAYRCGADWRRQLLDYLAGNRQRLAGAIESLAGIRWTPPEASFLAWLDCREMGLDDAGLKRFFVERAGLGLSAGLDFGAPGSGFMRLNFAMPESVLERALHRLRAACQG